MAKFKITRVVDNKILIENNSEYDDIFLRNNKKLYKKYNLIDIADFTVSFFIDNHNLHIYDINIDTSLDDVQVIIKYKYIENKNGYHIYSDFTNFLLINKELYFNTCIQDIIYKYQIDLKEDYDYNITQLQSEALEIKENCDRISPKSCGYIYDDLNNVVKDINIDDYHITKEELSEYVSSNKSYIREYIYSNWDVLRKVIQGSSLVACSTGAIAILLALSEKYNIGLNLISLAYFISSLTYISSIMVTEEKVNKYAHLDGNTKRQRKKKLNKPHLIDK